MITADHFIAPFLTGVHFEYKSRIIRMSKTPGSLIGFRGLNISLLRLRTGLPRL